MRSGVSLGRHDPGPSTHADAVQPTFVIDLSLLVVLMASADDRCTYDLDMPWPLHRCLVDFATKDLTKKLLIEGLSLGVFDHSGVGIASLDQLIADLLYAGTFVASPDGARELVLNPELRPKARQTFMALPAPLAQAVYRAALVWATFSSTLSKNFATARKSPAATQASSPPNPRQQLALV